MRATGFNTVGIVVAALVIGVALIMPIDVGPKLFGYPALALVLFLLAAAAAGSLLVSIVFSDIPQLRWRKLGQRLKRQDRR